MPFPVACIVTAVLSLFAAAVQAQDSIQTLPKLNMTLHVDDLTVYNLDTFEVVLSAASHSSFQSDLNYIIHLTAPADSIAIDLPVVPSDPYCQSGYYTGGYLAGQDGVAPTYASTANYATLLPNGVTDDNSRVSLTARVDMTRATMCGLATSMDKTTGFRTSTFKMFVCATKASTLASEAIVLCDSIVFTASYANSLSVTTTTPIQGTQATAAVRNLYPFHCDGGNRIELDVDISLMKTPGVVLMPAADSICMIGSNCYNITYPIVAQDWIYNEDCTSGAKCTVTVKMRSERCLPTNAPLWTSGCDAGQLGGNLGDMNFKYDFYACSAVQADVAINSAPDTMAYVADNCIFVGQNEVHINAIVAPATGLTASNPTQYKVTWGLTHDSILGLDSTPTDVSDPGYGNTSFVMGLNYDAVVTLTSPEHPTGVPNAITRIDRTNSYLGLAYIPGMTLVRMQDIPDDKWTYRGRITEGTASPLCSSTMNCDEVATPWLKLRPIINNLPMVFARGQPYFLEQILRVYFRAESNLTSWTRDGTGTLSTHTNPIVFGRRDALALNSQKRQVVQNTGMRLASVALATKSSVSLQAGLPILQRPVALAAIQSQDYTATTSISSVSFESQQEEARQGFFMGVSNSLWIILGACFGAGTLVIAGLFTWYCCKKNDYSLLGPSSPSSV
jgi:hypothetical protein